MTTDQIKQIKELYRIGGEQLIEQIVNEIVSELYQPKFDTNASKLVYDTGYYNGNLNALEVLSTKLLEYAKS